MYFRYSRKLRRCAVLSVRASTRVKNHAVLRLSLDVVLNAAWAFLKSKPTQCLSLKMPRPHSKMALSKRFETLGSKPAAKAPP